MYISYIIDIFTPLKLKGVIYMSFVSMNIRMDSEIKKQAQELFSNIGMDMTTAINVFLRQAILHDGLPFSVRNFKPNKKTAAAIEDVENGRNLSPVFNSVKDAKEWLDA